MRKTALMESLLPRLQIALPEKTALDPSALFTPKPREIELEIGFGAGEHLAALAAQNPSTGFLGAEPFINGIANLLDLIDKERLGNIRIYPDDARLLLDALPGGSLARVHVLFPDPWPKARHEKRRFIGPENLKRLARVLRKGGELHIATDDRKLALWMLAHLGAAEDFAAARPASGEPPPGWVATRYERKALKAGRRPVYAVYKRI